MYGPPYCNTETSKIHYYVDRTAQKQIRYAPSFAYDEQYHECAVQVINHTMQCALPPVSSISPDSHKANEVAHTVWVHAYVRG